MKLLTTILIFLAAFILGYAIADYTKLPNRIYVIDGQDIDIQWRKGGREGIMTVAMLPKQLLYFSKEKPKDKLKHISREAMLDSWEEIKTMSQESFFVTLETQGEMAKRHHALLHDMSYHEGNKHLVLKITPPLEEDEITPHAVNLPKDEHFHKATLHIFQMH